MKESLGKYLATSSIVLLLTFMCGCKNERINDKGYINAEFIGTEQCAGCHKQEYKLYKNSDHDLAMKYADSTTVLGDFNNSKFNYYGIASRFYKRDNKYYVFTEGHEGEMNEFQIKYTFGYYPLQQYLIEFENGKIQCLPLCWDTRSKTKGGQKWFHIYGNEEITHNNILHWTRVNQNWNYMCADCHSTNLKKNYDPNKNEYNTTWSEINVGCEACHGPGSLHEEWAKKKEIDEEADYPNKGLTKILKNVKQNNWVMNYSTGIAELQNVKKNNKEIETCAPCHSHRSKIDDDIKPVESFYDNYIPSLLNKDLYFDDGQIKEEVYVYGSFLQSKMFHAGVTCTDCHQPHSTKVYSKGDELCFKCHLPEKFANITHHHHKYYSEGARCINCHMPQRIYMQIDGRRDHSFRIPRPDISEKIKAPNTCNDCHTDKSVKWAKDKFISWYGQQETHFGEVFNGALNGDIKYYELLINIIDNSNLPEIIRATGISLLTNYPNKKLDGILKKYSQDKEPLIRLSAISTSKELSSEERIFLIENLSDSIKSVVVTASQNFSNELTQNLTDEEKKLLEKGIKDYLHSQRINADHPSALINLGYFYYSSGAFVEAEEQYKKAIKLEPLFSPAYVNLADIYRETGKDSIGKEILLGGLKIIPNDAPLNFSLALFEIRNGNKINALPLLEKAVRNDPGNEYYLYVYELAKQ